MFGFNTFAQNPFSSITAGQTLLGVASVSGTATLTANAYRIQISSGSITGTATTTASGLALRFGTGSVTSSATLSALASRPGHRLPHNFEQCRRE